MRRSAGTTVLTLAAALVTALPDGLAAGVIVSGVDFIPDILVSSDPNRSQLVLRGGHVVFNDGTFEPVKRTSRTGGVVTPLAKALGVPLSLVVHGGFAYASSGCAVFRSTLDGASSTVLARTSDCPAPAEIAVDDANVYFVTKTLSPNTWTIRRVPVSGGAVTPLVATGREVRGLATDGANVYWLEEDWPEAPPQSRLRRIPVGGGTPVDLAVGLRALRGGLVLQGTDLFFSDSNHFDSYRVFRAPTAGGGAVTLTDVATGATDPVTDIAIDASRVYWTIKGAVRAVPITGGPAETVVPGLDSPTSVAVAGGEVLWSETVCCGVARNGALKKRLLTGGPVQVLAAERDWPSHVTIDGGQAFWLEGGSYGQDAGYGRVLRMPVAGGLPASVADAGPGLLPPLAADDSYVYFANKATLKRVSLAGGPVEELGRGASTVQEIVTDGERLYWTEWFAAHVYTMPVAGGPVTIAGPGIQGSAESLGQDVTHVYWVDHSDRLVRAPKPGGATSPLLDVAFTRELLVSGGEMFWVEQDSGLVRRAASGGSAPVFVTNAEAFSQVSLAADASWLFWIGQDLVCRVPRTGGNCTPIDDAVDSTIIVPNAIAADGFGGVFWTETFGGTVEASYGLPPVTAVSLAAATSSALEGAGAAAVRVQLTTANGLPLSAPVTVPYATADGTAVAGQHYTAASGILTFPAGAASGSLASIAVPLADDAVDEVDREFTLALATPVGAALEAPFQQTIVIRDDDAPPLASIADVTVAEGSCASIEAVLSVTLSAASAKMVQLDFATQDGTASGREDYGPTAGTLSFAPGATRASVTVPVRGDLLAEPAETFSVTLTPRADALVADGEAQVTITDDDAGSVPFAAELVHGSSVWEDLAATPAADTDLFQLAQEPFSSYEIVVDAASGDLAAPGTPLALERVACGGSGVAQSAVAVGTGALRSLRWENAGPFEVIEELVRVRSGGCTTACGGDDVYRIRAYDTTHVAPRFNNSGSQTSVLVIQNPSERPVSGHVHFWNAAGFVLLSAPFAVPSKGVHVVNTATLVPGQSGSLTISHDARYAELAGKLISVEPATGFSFDTALLARPR